MPDLLPADFYDRDPVVVARDLVGCVLHVGDAAGIIVETEAYHEREPSCHAHRGQTPRNAPLFAAPGLSYVYFTYGMHWCMNVVCEAAGVGAAVLIRALEPITGLDAMRERRRGKLREPADRDLCSGPAKLCQALAIDGADNLQDVTSTTSRIKVAAAASSEEEVVSGPRIGISAAQELPWRFGRAGSPWLSRPFPTA